MSALFLSIQTASTGIWIYFILFAIILFISSYKIRHKFAPKYLFTFQRDADFQTDETNQLKRIETCFWFVKFPEGKFKGGWNLTLDCFILIPLENGENAPQKLEASHDGKHFDTEIFWIYTSKNQQWALYKYAGMWDLNPLNLLTIGSEDTDQMRIPVLTESGIEWKNTVIENELVNFEKQNKNILLAGHPVVNQKGNVCGFLNKNNDQFTFEPVNSILQNLQVSIK